MSSGPRLWYPCTALQVPNKASSPLLISANFAFVGFVNFPDRSAPMCCRCCKRPGFRLQLLQCTACQKVWYCSVDCQGKDAKRHKAVCRMTAKVMAAAAAKEAAVPVPVPVPAAAAAVPVPVGPAEGAGNLAAEAVANGVAPAAAAAAGKGTSATRRRALRRRRNIEAEAAMQKE